MPRYALKIEYHGGPFSGWQRQNSQATVQGAIEDALSRLQSTPAHVQGAGRTDAGVHATGQIAHVDLEQNWDPFRLSEALNYHLKPTPVAILNAAETDPEFHARFDAIHRHYLFRILVRRAQPALADGLVWHIKHPLDVDAMRKGAAHLIGKHDFTTFRSTMCQAQSPVKSIDRITIDETHALGQTELSIRVEARSFLHNQVRSIVGTLERVGAGSWSPADVKTALKAKDRAACGPVCPPYGLYLEQVIYPDDPFATR